jgi:ELWxxDGT repeat protein
MKKFAFLLVPVLALAAVLTSCSQDDTMDSLKGASLKMVKDINTDKAGSSPSGYVKHSDDYIYFTANDGIHGAELWRTDGTEENTEMVKDVTPGKDSSSIGNITSVNSLLYFVANNDL